MNKLNFKIPANVKKLWAYISIFLFNIVTVVAVQVSQQETVEPVDQGLMKTVIVTGGSIGIIILGFALVIFILYKILFGIWKKIQAVNYKEKDFLYTQFESDIQQTHINRDPAMKRKLKRSLWLFWRRNPVYCNSSKGFKYLGQYNGECKKKENYYLISIYNKIGFFKFVDQIILIPFELSHIINKIDVNGGRSLVLNCEGVDTVGNTEYYLIPLIEDPKDSHKVLDFADKIHKEYFESITHRDIIKRNLLGYRENIIKSVEANPSIHFGRRIEKK